MSDRSPIGLLSRCPRCHRGPLFVGVLAMHKACTACGMNYEQEPGQHFAAMVLAYVLGAVVGIPLFFVLLVKGASPLAAIGLPFLVLLVLSPLNVRISRLACAHLMFHLHRARR